MLALVHAIAASSCLQAQAAELAQTIERIKPSIVGIGTFLKVRSPAIVFVGTGFAVGDGRHVVTNAHTVTRQLDEEKKETRIVLVSRGFEPPPRDAELIAVLQRPRHCRIVLSAASRCRQ